MLWEVPADICCTCTPSRPCTFDGVTMEPLLWPWPHWPMLFVPHAYTSPPKTGQTKNRSIHMYMYPLSCLLCVSARQCPSPVEISMTISPSSGSISHGEYWRGSVVPLPTPLPLPNEYTWAIECNLIQRCLGNQWNNILSTSTARLYTGRYFNCTLIITDVHRCVMATHARYLSSSSKHQTELTSSTNFLTHNTAESRYHLQ